MADFDLIQTDAQVQSILNDGQNMQGAGAQTTLTTESVLLKDVNGNYHKILKSSFTEAIRDTLAGLLVNNDKGTTINQIAAIASGDFGSITPANLASVLGETVTNNVQRLGLDFVYVPHITGTSDDPSQMAAEVLNAIPNNAKSSQGYGAIVFTGIYEYNGQKMFYGYWYGGDNKPYATIHFIFYDSGNITKVNKNNNTYTVYTITGTAI